MSYLKIIITVIISCAVGILFMRSTDPPNLINLFVFGFASMGVILSVNWIIGKIKSLVTKTKQGD